MYWFLYGSSKDLVLPPYYVEVVNYCSMTCGVTVVICWGRTLELFLEPLPKCSWEFSNIFFIILSQSVTFKSIYHNTLSNNIIIVLVSQQEVLNGIICSEKYLSPMFSNYVLKALTQTLVLPCMFSFHWMWLLCCVVISITVVVTRIRLDTVLYLDPAQTPCGLFTS